jgi:hypothetical protein
MNYCTKCQSIYCQPGTCNCYAAPGLTPYPTPPGTTTVPFPNIPWTPLYSPTITTPHISWDFGTTGGNVTIQPKTGQSVGEAIREWAASIDGTNGGLT